MEKTPDFTNFPPIIIGVKAREQMNFFPTACCQSTPLVQLCLDTSSQQCTIVTALMLKSFKFIKLCLLGNIGKNRKLCPTWRLGLLDTVILCTLSWCWFSRDAIELSMQLSEAELWSENMKVTKLKGLKVERLRSSVVTFRFRKFCLLYEKCWEPSSKASELLNRLSFGCSLKRAGI